MDTAALLRLRDEVSGDVVLPGDERYGDLARLIVHTGRPAAVVRCRSTADVVAAVRSARDQGLEISVRSGGHSNAGYSTNVDGLVIDLTEMNAVEVLDPERRLVRLGAGARWAQVAAALAPHGLSITSGDTASVGVGGLLVGGGIGWMVRRYGLAIDNVVGAELVTADGSVLRADARENPELFWALRGGSGNFGVVTSFEVRACRVSRVFFGTLYFRPGQTPAVLRAMTRYMRTAVPELTTSVKMFPTFGAEAPPLMVLVCYAGEDAEAAARAIDPIRGFGDLVDDDVSLRTYGDILAVIDPLPPGWQPRVRNRFAPALPEPCLDAVVRHHGLFSTLFVEIRYLGGAMARVPAHATAFAHRDAEAMIMGVLLGSPQDNEPLLPRYEEFWQELAPYTRGAYTGFLSDLLPADLDAAFPEPARSRLVEVKRRYDAQNTFHLNPNIAP